jgi:uncharacterized repeat protein (TIGR01451 family)
MNPHPHRSRPPSTAPTLARLAGVTLLLLLAAACTQNREAPAQDSTLRTKPAALFTNNGFEDGTLSSWTVTTNANRKGIIFPPTSIADLQLEPGGRPLTFARTVPADGTPSIPAGLTADDSLRYPVYGKWAAVVNEKGNNFSVNTLIQQATVKASDVDPADGKVHVRFLVAPVLENPNHTEVEQPYFYIQVKNLTTGQVLRSAFNYANQPGVPWKVDKATGTINYTEWQIFDIAPGNALLRIGDTVEMRVIAAACKQGAHWGEVYVDGFGAFLEGLSVAASVAQFANADTDLTYTYLLKNSGQVASTHTTLTVTLPAMTSFVSVEPPPGFTCTPPVGNPATFSCDVGTLAPTASQVVKLTVHIDPTAGGKVISHGNYTISGDTLPPLLGPLVETQVTLNTSYADLSASVTDGVTVVRAGQANRYTVTVTNAGPSAVTGARLLDNTPAPLTGASWTCTASGGAQCSAASGSGFIDTLVDLPPGSQVQLLLDTTVDAGTASPTVHYTVTVSPPATATESDSTNNTGSDLDNIGSALTLTVQKDATANGQGAVVSSPAAIQCGNACTSASATFLAGSQVSLTATPATGSHLAGWTGGGCTGTTNPCVLTLTEDTTVTARFELDSYPITTRTIGGGTLTCPASVNYGQSVTCTLTPPPGFRLQAFTDNGTDSSGAVTGSGPYTYVITSASGPHDLVVTFSGCSTNADCGGGACVDGVCCNTACDGQCEACDVPGSVGTCTPVIGAPHGSRAACASDGSMCGGTCDGSSRTSCAYPGAATQCRAGSCANGTATLAASCDGAGACPPEQTQKCDPYVCGANACLGNCTRDSECSDGLYCAAGVCTPKQDNGGVCGAANQCKSGTCVDGVCCNTACDGQCEACDVAGSVGTCAPVTGAPHGGRAACASDGSACGGTCDGSNPTSCAYPGAATQCRAAACEGATAILAASCNGTGACPPVQTQACDPYVCGATACQGNCTQDSECAADAYCSAGVCTPKQDNGGVCGAANQCKSGTCVDGVCCNTACDGQCEACDVTGSVGTCVAVSGAPHGNRPACASDGTACGGTCAGDRQACSYPGASTQCRAASCNAGLSVEQAFCGGAGACVVPQGQQCGTYACGEEGCKERCDSDSDCASDSFCAAHQCQQRGDHARWTVQGAGTCSSTGGNPLLWPAVMLLAWVLARRGGGRRAGAFWGLLALVLPVAARAQEGVSQSFQVERFQPQPGSADVLGVQSPQVGKHLAFNVGLFASYARLPLRVLHSEDPGLERGLLLSQTTASLAASLSLFERIELGAVLPVTVAQFSELAPLVDPRLGNDIRAAGMDDLRLSGKVSLLHGERLGLAVGLPLTLPTAGAQDYRGQEGLTFNPRLIAELRGEGGVRLMANAGVMLRQPQQLLNLHVGNAFTYGLGGTLDLLPRERVELLATFTGERGLSPGNGFNSPMELNVALRWTTPQGLGVTFGGGPGLNQGYGAPRFRLLAALQYSPSRATPAPTPVPAPVVENRPEPAVPCEAVASTPPAPVIQDSTQEVRIQSGDTATLPSVASGAGASDVQLVADVTQPASGSVTVGADGTVRYQPKDGFSGQDTFTYRVLACTPAPVETRTVVVHVEPPPAPPVVVEPAPAPAPAPAPPAPTVQNGKLSLSGKVYFDNASASVQKTSLHILDTVATFMREHPEVRIRVEAHTDNRGAAQSNLLLSQQRAAWVLNYLVKEKGIAQERLQSNGLGMTKPLDTNDTDAGRQNNRRVEFHVLDTP